MEIMRTCACSEQACIENKRFSVAYLESDVEVARLHNHEYLEIYLNLSGGKRFMIDGSIHPMENNDVFIINNNQLHYPDVADKHRHKRYIITIMPDCLASLSSYSTNLRKLFYNSNQSSRRIPLTKAQKDFIVGRIKDIENQNGYGADLIENSILIEIILFLIDIANAEDESVQKCDNSYIRGMLTYIRENLDGDLSLDTLAKEFFLSKGYICRLFKEQMDTTVSKYISTKRIANAKVLLSTGASVQDAALQSGFNDYANFIRHFTKEVGVSPKRYGKENRFYQSV